jgi:ribose 5-phosphate isomerase RpiB
MCIVANKWPHVYAARCTTTHEAADCRTFNNANVLCLGSRVTPADEACQ